MKNQINLTKLLLALAALLFPAITQAHSGAEGLLHEIFHDQYHALGALGLLAVLAIGAWVAYAGGRALWGLMIIGVAIVAAGVAFGLS